MARKELNQPYNNCVFLENNAITYMKGLKKGCEYLSKHFINGLWIANPLLCRKPIIRICPSSSWEPISYKKFNTLSYKLKYTEWTDVTLEWIMKHLSVDQCIQYLKERGIMACPVLKGE